MQNKILTFIDKHIHRVLFVSLIVLIIFLGVICYQLGLINDSVRKSGDWLYTRRVSTPNGSYANELLNKLDSIKEEIKKIRN